MAPSCFADAKVRIIFEITIAILKLFFTQPILQHNHIILIKRHIRIMRHFPIVTVPIGKTSMITSSKDFLRLFGDGYTCFSRQVDHFMDFDFLYSIFSNELKIEL
jgi:hypothetical protein